MAIIYDGTKDTKLYKNAIPEVIDDLMQKDSKVCWLDADLSGCSGTKSNFDKDDRYVNCGIAEANMAGIAAGMSSTGCKPYIHSFAPFASRRCFDQVFLSSGYADNPITVVGTDPGITAAFNGGTHMPFEDIALYRTIPGATICDCTDVVMLKNFLTQAKDMDGVKYIRVGRKDSYKVYSDDEEFKPGQAKVLREGNNGLIIASGIMVKEAMEAAKELDCTVIDPYTIKPLDVDCIYGYAKKLGKVVVCDNHNAIGGLVSAVEDALIGLDIKFGHVAVDERFGQVGPQDFLREEYDLTDAHIKRVFKSL